MQINSCIYFAWCINDFKRVIAQRELYLKQATVPEFHSMYLHCPLEYPVSRFSALDINLLHWRTF